MRQLRVLLVGISVLIGVPWLLIAVGGGPVSAVVRLRGDALTSGARRLAAVMELGTWLAWAWICLAIVLQICTSRRSEKILVGHNRLVALFVAALWSVLATMRSAPTTPQVVLDPPVTIVDIPEMAPARVPVAPIASVQCALIAEYMLRRFSERRSQAVTGLLPGREIAPLSRTSDLFWRSLRLRLGEQPVEMAGGIPVGLDQSGDVVVSAGPVEIRGATVEEEQQIVGHLALAVDAVGGEWPAGDEMSLVRDSHGWQTATRRRMQPFGLSVEERDSFSRLMHESAITREVSSPTRAVPTGWLVCVRLLGPVEARWHNDSEVAFRKSKSLELLAWLVTHPDRPTRVAARTAMWMVDVQSSYFNNLVSELRGVLGATGDSDRFELLDKTSQDRLILDERVISDADVLRCALERFRGAVTEETRSSLRAALSLVRNLPFSGSDYLWPDPEGITSNLVHMVISASLDFAKDALAHDDVDGVYFATDKGLKVFPGDEELLRLRSEVARKARPFVRGERSG